MTEREYVAGHVQEALAQLGETDVRVSVVGDGGRLVLTGTVTTSARRAAVVECASSNADGLEVLDEITVLRSREPDADDEERLGS